MYRVVKLGQFFFRKGTRCLFFRLKDQNSDSGDEETNNVDLGPIEYPPDQHRLQHPYWLWYSKRPTTNIRNIQAQTQGYSQALRLVAQIGTVEQWWSMYSHLVRLHDLPPHTDLHLFKHGIQPMWEDDANAKGGKWVRNAL